MSPSNSFVALGTLKQQLQSRFAGETKPNPDLVVAGIVKLASEVGCEFGPSDYLAAVGDKIDSEHAAPPNMMSTCCCRSSSTGSSHEKSFK